MAKRELSSTLKNLKFMQRAREKEEKMKKEEEEEEEEERERENKITLSANGNKKCVVIMEGDPKPEAVSGRMSFQNFNPSIDKLNENKEAHKHRLFAVSSADRNEVSIGRCIHLFLLFCDCMWLFAKEPSELEDCTIYLISLEEYMFDWWKALLRLNLNLLNVRENEASEYGKDELNKDQENDALEDLKRKKQRVDEDAQGSYSSPRDSLQPDESQASSHKGKYNSYERGKLDWKLLRPPLGRAKRS